MAKRTSAKSKLIGWGVLAAACLAVVGIFLISRALSPPATAPVTTASSVATIASSQAPATTSSETAAAPSQPASSAQPASSSSTIAIFEPDTMDQGSRQALVNTLIQQGVFTGVQAVGSPPKVGVTPLFRGLDPDLQRQFVAAVYSYVNRGAAGTDPLQVIDATTGNVLGKYTSAGGLELL